MESYTTARYLAAATASLYVKSSSNKYCRDGVRLGWLLEDAAYLFADPRSANAAFG
jgi:hypothetical protein